MDIPIILWLNLDKDLHRRERIINQFVKYNLKNIRIESIPGSNYKLNIPLESEKYIFKRNQIACSSSHLKAIKYYVDNYESIGDYCLIAEDDIDISSIELWSKSFWIYLEVFKNVDWNTLQLQMYPYAKVLNKFLNNFKIDIPHKTILSQYYGAGMYLIKYERACELIRELNLTNKPYIERFVNDINYYNVMEELDRTHADHKLIYDKYTYTLPLFFLHEEINSSISKEIRYNSMQTERNLLIKNFMKNIL